MKKLLSLTLAIMMILSFVGCEQQELSVETSPPATETTGTLDTTAPPETTVPETAPTEVTLSTEPSEVTTPAQSTEATEGTEPTQPQKPTDNTGKKEEETKPADPPETQPTQPVETTPPVTQPPETEPPETQPPATEPPTTEPPTTRPTEPAPTEPVGCQHDWMCIHHAEEGHWRAGIVCDCGWMVYGDPDELVALWNAHSASYPAAEALFDHGGFGCVDEWIVDKPAYDEWVCSHCGEPKL